MIHLTISYNGIIFMVEIQDKFDSNFFNEMMDRDVLPNTPIFT